MFFQYLVSRVGSTVRCCSHIIYLNDFAVLTAMVNANMHCIGSVNIKVI